MAPYFSVVIAVRDGWDSLKNCLGSLCRQKGAPEFEVVLVDDGSRDSCPQEVSCGWPFRVTVIRQAHQGVSVARNTGISAAIGDVIVIVDSDSVLHEDCLQELSTAVRTHPMDSCFQLNVTGDRSTLVGRVECLHLTIIQESRLRADGHIGYLNTTGAAIRRPSGSLTSLFDPQAIRGEDTQVLADLMAGGELPRFVPGAIVYHAVKLRLHKYVFKAITNSHDCARTFRRIQDRGIDVRLTSAERLRVLGAAWKKMRKERLGVSAFLVLTLRQALSLGAISWWSRRQNGLPQDGRQKRLGSAG